MTHNELPAFTGPVFRSGDAGYAGEVAGFQTDNPHRPALVVGAAHAEDVRAAVEYAARQGLPIAVQATGHGLSVPADSGVLISTRRLDTVSVDPVTRTARVGAGVRAGALIEAAVAHGLAPLNGSSASVGVVGYHLGGGLGILARTFGYAADHVRAIELVTADGRMRRLVPGGDLFGAVLGSGGNFGVVTALELELVPVTEVYGGQLTFESALVPTALATWREWTTTLPDELTSAITMMTMPDVPGVPEPLRGRYLATINIAYVGPAAAGEELVAPLRAIGPRIADNLRRMPYADTESIYRDPDFPHAYTATNALLKELTPEAAEDFRSLTGPDSPVPVVAGFRHLGGSLARPGTYATAVGHRAATYVARAITAPGESAWAQHELVAKTLVPWTLGHHLNFVYGGAEHANAAQTRAGYEPATYERLRSLKNELDPANLFRFNRNI